jgi:hypothetical protein
MRMNEIAPSIELAFEDAEVPVGIDMKPIQPALIPIEAYTSR